VFSFVPDVALRFHSALEAGDRETTDALLRRFYIPFARLRERRPGYAVSLVKAGVGLVGPDPGGVRPPLSDPTPEEREALARLIETASEIRA
jgi:5-dehydro-4-deoxyglucarate dehydratase